MLENTESLLPDQSGRSEKSVNSKLRVILVGFEENSLDELERLLTTLGVEPAGSVRFVLRNISPATYIGSGKIQEIKREIDRHEADAVVIDVELSPNQLRNLEKEFGKPTLDRPGVIIEIFSRHARTKEAKTQVALARLQYLLPRLAHYWSHFERQRGGSPGSRGMGEKQIEVDRRLVKKRIALLKKRLSEIEEERVLQRSGRKEVLKVAIVGYTNAGKSTLLNALTQSEVRAEDKLFATLDASIKSLDPNSHPPIVAIDTVGFISNLPHSLVASFRSTLEELHEADLLVHVVDASSPQAKEQLEVTESVLKELKVGDKPKITVLNKIDRVEKSSGIGGRNLTKVLSPGGIPISALNASDVIKLRDVILGHFRKNLELWEILVPYSESKLESRLFEHGSIEVSRHLEKGTFYRLRMESGWAKKLGLDKYRI